MGLDRDDTIVRRRLRQKLEFLSDDLSNRVMPTDADLQDFLQSHVDNFKTETTFTFRQIYLNPQLHRNNLHRNEARLLADLQRAGQQSDLTSLGDPFLLPQSFQDISLSELKNFFGEQFATELSALHPASGRQASRLAMVPIWSTSSNATKDVFPRLPRFTMKSEASGSTLSEPKRPTSCIRRCLRATRSGSSHRKKRKSHKCGDATCHPVVVISLYLRVWCACARNAPRLSANPSDGVNTYDVFWKVPAIGDGMRLSLYVQLPETCSNLAQPSGLFSTGAYTESGVSSAKVA